MDRNENNAVGGERRRTRCAGGVQLGLCALLLAAGSGGVAAGEPPLVGEANAGPFCVLAQTSQADADRVARLLQQQAEVIGALVPELRPERGARFRVLLLRDRRELRRFLSRRGVSGGSTFCYVHHEDWRRRRIIGYAAPNAALARGLTHELVHALLRARISRPPVWFDEGLAEWLELATPSRAGRSSKAAPPPVSPARPPVNAAWLGALKRTLGAERGALTVSALLSLPAAGFGRRSRQAYPLSWGLCEVLGRDRLRSLLGRLGPEATEVENRVRLSNAMRDLAPPSGWAERLGRLSARGAPRSTAWSVELQPVLE